MRDMKNIVLIGMPGVGKSTIGVILAKELGYQFVDADLLIQKQEKRLLKEIISEEGIEGFIAIENQVNASIEANRTVIATGGSVVYGREAMEHLGEIATVIYLKLSYKALRKRLGNLKNRGVVLRDGQTLKDLYEERVVLYEKYADKVVYIGLSQNVGFGRANNEGVKVAKGRNILFLNPDTVLLNNAIKILSDALDTNSKVGACGGNLYNAAMNPTTSYSLFFPSIFDFFRLPVKLYYGKERLHNYTDRKRRVAFIIGADLMVKASVLKETGAFDPGFFMYCEETELCYRIRSKRYDILSIPTARIQHLESQSISNIERKALWFYNSERYYYKVTHSKLYCSIVDFFYPLMARIEMYKSSKGKYKYELWHCKYEYDRRRRKYGVEE